ncbi:MAG: TIGR02300 family protein [Alphaproteobacteria bacterium]|nr:TIGR02300 family protein [Alphaproteobacteria bacterium]
MNDAPLVTRNARGTKRRCLSCELPFYDLARDPIICPNCAETFQPPVVLEPRISEPRPVPNTRRPAWTPKKSAPVAEADEEIAAKPDDDQIDNVEEIDEDEIEADDDTLLDPEAEADDDEVIVAPAGDDD